VINRSVKELGVGKPIVIDKDRRVIGGNKTLAAAIKQGYTSVAVIKTDGSVFLAHQRDDVSLDSKEGRELAYVDNLSSELNLAWSKAKWEKLDEWGVPSWEPKKKEVKNKDGEVVFSTELDSNSQYVVLKFEKHVDWLQVKTLLGLESTYSKRANGKPWSKGIGRVVDGVEAIEKIKEEWT